MKVKVGDKIYDSEKEPIMIILSDIDKSLISNMKKEAKRYCSFPQDKSKEEIIKFMEFFK